MTHSLSQAQFEALCAGPVDPGTIGELRRSQYSRRRLLLAALIGELRNRPGVFPLADTDSAWQTLAAVDKRAPDVVEDLLMRPSVGVWLARATRRLHGVPLDGPPLGAELGFLRVLAAVAAVRAGSPDSADLAVVDDATPMHRHRAMSGGQVLNVEIDDCTPYRWFAAPEPPRRLDAAELLAWRDDLDDAWKLLTRWHPRSAAELAVGLVTVAPVMQAGHIVGASATWAFGGVVLAKAKSAATLAATLVHEFQHSKLNALLDLTTLHTRDQAAMMYVPWRDDPRPLTGVLHGIYAFTSEVEFWYLQRTQLSGFDFTFVHRRLQVETAIEDLATASDLTESGAHLVASAAHRLRQCPMDDVPSETIEAAKAAIAHHRTRWGRA